MQILTAAAALVLAVLPPQDPTQRIHDLAGVLSPADQAALESLAHDVEQKTAAQLAVVTVPSLEGLTVDTYAHQLFNSWGIGQKDVNNGVLFLIAPKDRRMRIEVGYGLEPLLTDSLCGEIRDQQIIPRFKENDYSGGIVAGTNRLAEIILSDPAAPAATPTRGRCWPAPPIVARSRLPASSPLLPSPSSSWQSSWRRADFTPRSYFCWSPLSAWRYLPLRSITTCAPHNRVRRWRC